MSIKRMTTEKEREINRLKKQDLIDRKFIEKYLIDLENRIKKLEKNIKN